MTYKKVKVFAPATVANVTCGFDILGFAIDWPGDLVTIAPSESPGIKIVEIKGDDGKLPTDAKKNTVTMVMTSCLNDKGLPVPDIDVFLEKKMPIGSGLGSSAASSVAGIFAIDAYLDLKMSKQEMLKYAMQGEFLACGAGHADNVAPSLYGGFILIRGYDPVDIIELPIPKNLYATVMHPHIEVNTKDARNVLKKKIGIDLAIKQWGNVAGLIAGITMDNKPLIKRSMHDVIVEPARSILIPGYQQAKDAALSAEVLGFGISGSGPSLFTLSENEAIANKAGEKMKKAFKQIGIESNIFVSRVGQSGAKLMEV